MFPFARFPGTDPVLGPEMKSTGEVMGIDQRFRHRLRQVAARRRDRSCRSREPRSCRSRTPTRTISCPPVEKLVELGFKIIATGGTRRPSGVEGHSGRTGQQGRSGPAAHRRPIDRRRGRAGVQHHRGLAVAEGQPFDPRPRRCSARCPISPPRRRAWRRRGRSRRCAATRLKSPRSNPIIPLPRNEFPPHLRLRSRRR